MRRRAAKVDVNQPAIVKGLRAIPGVSVKPLSAVGDGCPDLLVGFRGRNFLLEVKDPEKPPSKRELTLDQSVFFAGWTGQAAKVETLPEALRAIGVDVFGP